MSSSQTLLLPTQLSSFSGSCFLQCIAKPVTDNQRRLIDSSLSKDYFYLQTISFTGNSCNKTGGMGFPALDPACNDAQIDPTLDSDPVCFANTSVHCW